MQSPGVLPEGRCLEGMSVTPCAQRNRFGTIRSRKRLLNVAGRVRPHGVRRSGASRWKGIERHFPMAKNPPLSLVDPTSTLASPPTNLGPSGQKVWQCVLSDYEITDAGGLMLLEQI